MRQKCSIKRDVELPVAIPDVLDVSVLVAKASLILMEVWPYMWRLRLLAPLIARKKGQAGEGVGVISVHDCSRIAPDH